MTIRCLAVRTLVLGIGVWLLSFAAGAAMAPEIRDSKRGDAQYRLSVMVEAVSPTTRSSTGQLDRCTVLARVTRLIREREHPSPVLQPWAPKRPRPGALIRTEVRCWAYDNRAFEPLAGRRIYYGGPQRYIYLEVWGSYVGGRFIVFDFVNRNGA